VGYLAGPLVSLKHRESEALEGALGVVCHGRALCLWLGVLWLDGGDHAELDARAEEQELDAVR